MWMEIDTKTERTTQSVFQKYAGEDIYFRKTHVTIALGRYPGEQLVSRSQAKRVLARISNFSEVILDFRGVDQIGQPFADEIFRVFKYDHPKTVLIAFNTNETIDKMIKYVQTDEPSLFLPFGDEGE